MITTSIIFQEVQYILIELRGLIKNRQISETFKDLKFRPSFRLIREISFFIFSIFELGK